MMSFGIFSHNICSPPMTGEEKNANHLLRMNLQLKSEKLKCTGICGQKSSKWNFIFFFSSSSACDINRQLFSRFIPIHVIEMQNKLNEKKNSGNPILMFNNLQRTNTFSITQPLIMWQHRKWMILERQKRELHSNCNVIAHITRHCRSHAINMPVFFVCVCVCLFEYGYVCLTVSVQCAYF